MFFRHFDVSLFYIYQSKLKTVFSQWFLCECLKHYRSVTPYAALVISKVWTLRANRTGLIIQSFWTSVWRKKWPRQLKAPLYVASGNLKFGHWSSIEHRSFSLTKSPKSCGLMWTARFTNHTFFLQSLTYTTLYINSYNPHETPVRGRKPLCAPSYHPTWAHKTFNYTCGWLHTLGQTSTRVQTATLLSEGRASFGWITTTTPRTHTHTPDWACM